MAHHSENTEGLKFAQLHLSYVWLNAGHPDKVVKLLTPVLLDIAGDPSLFLEISAVLVEAHRQIGHLPKARSLAEPIINMLLADQMIGSLEEPFEVYLNIHRTFRELKDKRAALLRSRIQMHLQMIAGKLENAEMRRRFLEHNPAYHKLNG